MKHLIFSIAVFTACLLSASCQKGDRSIIGEYEYDNGLPGLLSIEMEYDFYSNGNVYNSRKIGTSAEFNTKGCDLYYKLNGEDIVIYHGSKGWKSEVRDTPYASGKYYGDYMIIDDVRYDKDR